MALHTVCQLEVDHLLAELHEKDDALVNALRDLSGYQLLSYVALQRNAELMSQNDRLRLCVRRSLDDTYGDLAPEVPRKMDTAA